MSFSRENSKEKSPKNGLFKPFFGLLSLAGAEEKSPKNGLFKPFFGLLSLAGAEGLEPSARGFGAALTYYSSIPRGVFCE